MAASSPSRSIDRSVQLVMKIPPTRSAVTTWRASAALGHPDHQQLCELLSLATSSSAATPGRRKLGAEEWTSEALPSWQSGRRWLAAVGGGAEWRGGVVNAGEYDAADQG